MNTPAGSSWLDSLRTRLRAPWPAWVFVALSAVLLALRKPWALHTPQLWAEDGSIFLLQNDQLGTRALWEPYMGYLHTLMRLTAWVASHTLDPRWWPAFYNGAAFALALGVIARLFSPRLALPGAPWLALAFFLGPQTGEVLINITNVQWFTGFVFVQQALIARPTNARQRTSDLLIVALAGLTGPEVIAFWPLLAWRWVRERNWDTFAVLLLATACAAVQGWFVLKTGPHFDFQNEAFHAAKFFPVIARRLLVWPLVGDKLALAWPHWLVGAIGCGLLAALVAWSLRRHERRRLRATVVAALVLITATVVYRARPDTWAADNLYFGDRYFFIPRILVAWLLVWELDAVPRVVRWLAGALLLTCALVHVKGYTLPAPRDYHWAQHVDPIRRGVRADIPILPEGWTLEYQGRPARK